MLKSVKLIEKTLVTALVLVSCLFAAASFAGCAATSGGGRADHDITSPERQSEPKARTGRDLERELQMEQEEDERDIENLE